MQNVKCKMGVVLGIVNFAFCIFSFEFAAAAAEALKEPFPDPYTATPEFVSAAMNAWMAGDYGKNKEPLLKAMALSFEPEFYTLSDLQGYSKPEPRSAALVKKALEKEQQGEYREALEIYQKVIDDHPDDLHRISKYGIFVPVAQYCQRRILQFPVKDLQFYREKHDQRAKEAYDQARAKNSLEGLAEVRDRMLATSYGGRAMLKLGDAALDRAHYLEALEYYETVRDFFPDKDLRTPEQALKIDYCHRMLGDNAGGGAKSTETGASQLGADELARLGQLVSGAKPDRPPFQAQLASAPHVAADDYTLFPPTPDPLALAAPVWGDTLPNSQYDFYVYSQPVLAGNSVIYRYKNMVFCRSVLNGELRWKNDLGGRVNWQDWMARQYPQEDVLVQDGLVFTPIFKVGPTLVALDEVTGQLKWARGPMAASTPEEARMRFECAPTGGPRTVYAGYVLDNIEGDSHVDTEYGVIALDSTTGRIVWRRAVCRYRPGLFTAGMAVSLRNRIRSFSSPPLYHQGTVYYCTNVGETVALDALSGQVKWSMRYPYYAFPYDIHDLSRQFGQGGGPVEHTRLRVYPHHPMLWYAQRPLLSGDNLYVLPVDSPYLFCLNRRNGSVLWAKGKGAGGKPEPTHGHAVEAGSGGAAYLLGSIRSGELVFVYSSRALPGCIHLLDPLTGKVVWESDGIVAKEEQPTLKYRYHYNYRTYALDYNSADWQNSARPFLTSDDKLYVSSCNYWGWPIFGWSAHLSEISLSSRKVLQERRYLSGELLANCAWAISTGGPDHLKELNNIPAKNDEVKRDTRILEGICADTVPENPHGPFLPFSRVTSRQYGTTFELRLNPRNISMLYDREAVKRVLAQREDSESLLARAELAIGDSRLDEAARLLKQCAAQVSSEDLDFRTRINQQLYQVHKQLARGAVRAGSLDQELANCLGMSRTANTLADEIETAFALSEAYERKSDFGAALAMLRNIVSVYGHYEYPVPSALGTDADALLAATQEVLNRGKEMVKNTLYREALGRSLELLSQGTPLYFSTLSPLDKDLAVRAGDLAAARIARLLKASPDVARNLERDAGAALAGKTVPEQLHRLSEFPATAAGQTLLDELFRKSAAGKGPESRQQMWRLADIARVCFFQVPEAVRVRVTAPPPPGPPASLAPPLKQRENELQGKEGTSWLVLERTDDLRSSPDLLFLGGRVQKRFDSKFLLSCMDLKTSQIVWQAREEWGGRVTEEISLKGKGNEPGFFEAYVFGDLVVVHGFFDVLAFDLAAGSPRWRYQAPFDFEIKKALASGDMLVLFGKAETLALYVPTEDPRGEVAWQQKEEGDLYVAPYLHGERVVSVRKFPFNVTVRYRATGRLIGRISLPDLTMHADHPLLKDGPKELPFAADGRALALSDGRYYLMLDIEKMKIAWKRVIDNSDPTRESALRFALQGDYFAVVKEDFDQKAIYMLSSRTGELLWNTDPKSSGSPQPLYNMLIAGGRILGIGVHPGQAFYFVARDCMTGRQIFSSEAKGYQSSPDVRMLPRLFGDCAVVFVRDRQGFEVRAFELQKGAAAATLSAKGTGEFGEHGRASATVQNGRLVLFTKDMGKDKLIVGSQ